jgi:hypothetical protein
MTRAALAAEVLIRSERASPSVHARLAYLLAALGGLAFWWAFATLF